MPVVSAFRRQRKDQTFKVILGYKNLKTKKRGKGQIWWLSHEIPALRRG